MPTVEFESNICGVPCLVVADIRYGHPGSRWEEPCDTLVELTITDRRGREAPWLTRKMGYREIKRLEEEALDQARIEREQI